MKKAIASRAAAGLALFSSTGAALAHGGHGAAEVHWHATDTSGFLMVVVLAGLALWLSRGE